MSFKFDPTYYGAHYPLAPNEPTWDERIEHNLECARLLRKVGSDEAYALSEILEGCRASAPCGNAACNLCGKVVQRAFFDALKSKWGSVPLMHFTVIPEQLLRPLGQLARESDLLLIEAYLSDILSKAGYGHISVLGFEDLCHRVDVRTGVEEWSRHFHLAIPAAEARGLTPKLRDVLPASPTITRRVKGVPITTDKQKRYIAKPRPSRKVWFATKSKSARPTEHWLKTPQLIESLLWLGKFKATDRVVELN